MIPTQINQVPEQTATRILSMARHRWLDGYPTRSGMAYVLNRMDQRTSFPSRFAESMADFDLHRKAFDEEFRIFLIELKSAFADEFAISDKSNNFRRKPAANL
jgi:acyl carrier protein phosphodiesterase